MSKGRLITRSVTTTRPVDMTLNLDCIEDSLSEAQLMMMIRIKENCQKVSAKLEELVKEHGARMICTAGVVSGYEYTLPGSKKTTVLPKPIQQSVPLTVNQGKTQPIKLNVINNTQNTGTPGNIQLVMNPRMGVILGTVGSSHTQAASSTTTTTTSTIPTTQGPSTTSQSESFPQARRRPRASLVQTQGQSLQSQPQKQQQQQKPQQLQKQQQKQLLPQKQQQQKTDLPEEAMVSTRGKSKSANSAAHTSAATKGNATSQNTSSLKYKTVKQQLHLLSEGRIWPTEETSIGGIAVGSKNAAADQIDESKKNLPDGREITFNKMNGGRTFPSLVVVARPHLRTKDIPLQVAQKERSDLDMKVKSVLMFSATKFAEWLIQRGLVRSEQYCVQHSSNTQKIKLKLGMYSDSSGTFPYSGGYVWISACCPDRFVSVFCGSIFQGAAHMPAVLLKLIYHWACQTNVQNVVSWVKVSNVYVKNFYTNLRSVCSAAVWDKMQMMGGKGTLIQVGVISLGTTSQDGNLRQVKVEVLGVLNPETAELRLRACDPLYDGDRSFKRRFNNILNPLKDWVHKDSKIVTDYTVDRSTLQEMGFNHVIQSSFTDQNPRNMKSNYHMMEYLRKIVPRMFQNTLSLLSRQMIQQFLDELVWREMFGATASRAFDNIILHIAEQTRLDVGDDLLDRMAKISANPFKDWSYSNKTQNSNTNANSAVSATLMSMSGSATTPQSLRETPRPSHAPTADSSSRSSNKPKDNLALSITPRFKPGPVRGKKRPFNSESPEPESKKQMSERDRNNERFAMEEFFDSFKLDSQVQLEEFYYATMKVDKSVLAKEIKSSCMFKCFLCSMVMQCNTEVMEHMISHVPARVPGQSESPVCRYCCSAFSSQHQMIIHVTEAHTKFGQCEGADMVVCGICEEKFGTGNLLLNHLSSMHHPSEMPYRCETCGYRTSSHKDVIDHYYKVHERGEALQCPYCLKVIQFSMDGRANVANVHAYLLHMQRHIVRREQGRGNKCSRCCLWFNQKSSLRNHQDELHRTFLGPKVSRYTGSNNGIRVPKQRLMNNKHIELDSPIVELPQDENLNKWNSGPIAVNVTSSNLHCQECEEDIDEPDHYPGEQRCHQCRYVTCCWRAFKEHQQQVHNERPMTSLVVPSPLINIPLEKKMRCPCGRFATFDGNQLAAHLIKCNRLSAYPTENAEPSGMLDSLGLVPKNT